MVSFYKIIKNMVTQNKKMFRVYCFTVEKGKDTILEICNNCVNTKTKMQPVYSYQKKVLLEKCEKIQIENKDIYIGDLQQIHTDDLPSKVSFNENTILKQEGFEKDEGLGYNNCFAYIKDKGMILLQNNINGVGYLVLMDMLNNYKESFKIQKEDIKLSVFCDNSNIDNINDVNEIEFNISNFKSIDDCSFNDFNTFTSGFNATSCKCIIKNKKKDSFLKNSKVKQVMSFLNKNKKDLSITTLKAKHIFEGENSELNFLQNRVCFKNLINVGKTIEYSTRKDAMENIIKDFFKRYK